MYYRVFSILLFVTSVLLPTKSIVAQGTNVTFGKNRVQYHDNFKEWSQYESENFITYWYGESRNIGQSTLLIAEQELSDITKLLEYIPTDKIEIIVYTDITDLKQTNLGSEDAFVNKGGQTKIADNKIFVYFDGNHNHLRRQIREGIGGVCLESMLFGASLQEIVQSAITLNIPAWYKQGLMSYIGESWSTNLDDMMRDYFTNTEKPSLKKMIQENPELAGHSFWYFIFNTYSNNTITNIIYLTKINRDVDAALLYVMGSDFERLTQSWESFYAKRYEAEKSEKPQEQSFLKIKNKRNLPLTQVLISPDGKKIAYAMNEIGRVSVMVQDLTSGKRERVFRYGFRNAIQSTDYDYPLLRWVPTSKAENKLFVVYEERDKIKYRIINLNKDEVVKDKFPDVFQRIHSIDFINSNELLLTATQRGFSDVYIYKLNTRQSEHITFDMYDDLSAIYIDKNDKEKGILFTSNRTNTTLERVNMDSLAPVGNFDIFYYDLINKPNELVKVTNTPFANEKSLMQVDTSYFSYLSDESGIYNRYNGYIKDVLMYYNKHITLKDGTVITIHQDSVLHHIDTTLIDTITFSPVIKPMAFVHQNFTFSRNIEQQSIAQNNIIANLIVHSGKNEVIVQNNVVASDSIAAPITYYRDRAYSSIINGVKAATTMHIDNIDLQSQPPPTVRTDSIPPPKKKSDFLFQSEFDDKPDDTKKDVEKKEVNPPQAEVLTPDESANKIIIPKNDTQNNLQSKHHQFRTSRIIPYRLKFRTDFLTSRLDNSMLFGGLDSYAGGKQGVNYPPMGLLLKANYKDILEDYEIETGARFPVSFNGSEYFVIFNNKKSRWDRSYALYRSQYKHGDANVRDKVTTTLAYGEMKYPFDIFSAIKFGATLRNDRTAPLILDGQSLERNITNTQRVGLKVAYIYDNTLDIVPNIKNGTRCKIEFEALKRFELKTVDKFSLSFNNGWMGVLTLDARHYKRIAKYSVLAFRLAGATSFGSENILYYMGGVDNWLFPKYNQSIPVPEGNYAFRTLASNMRGFAQNIRNGTSYFVTNTELRVPVFTYFTQKRIKSSLIRNFQLVGFFDLGTAWHGLTPFSPSNPLNAVEISNSQVTVKVNYFRDPLVASYGYGLRTTIFGYWVRLDYGKGIETRVVQPAVWHFSIGYDF